MAMFLIRKYTGKVCGVTAAHRLSVSYCPRIALYSAGKRKEIAYHPVRETYLADDHFLYFAYGKAAVSIAGSGSWC